MKKSSTFTLVEMMIVIAIIAILAALLMPALNRAIDSARSMSCKGNLRQIQMCLNMYGNDNADWFPSIWSWCGTGSGGLQVYMEGNRDVYYSCPDNPWGRYYFTEGRTKCLTYGLSTSLGGVYTWPSRPPCHRLSEVDKPSETISFADGRGRDWGNKNTDRFFVSKTSFGNTTHNSIPNFSWVDGHVSDAFAYDIYNVSYYWNLNK